MTKFDSEKCNDTASKNPLQNTRNTSTSSKNTMYKIIVTFQTILPSRCSRSRAHYPVSIATMQYKLCNRDYKIQWKSFERFSILLTFGISLPFSPHVVTS